MKLARITQCMLGIMATMSIKLHAVAQIPKDPVNIQSPNVSSIGLFGEIPVSNFSGIPQIQIPFYELKEKGITVPIEISYHASGVRPDVHPGWVGLNWNLNCGGVISRKVNGGVDEFNNKNQSGQTLPSNYASNGKYLYGYYNYCDRLKDATWNQQSFLKNAALNGVTDLEPDEFNFSFGGYSGKFYLTPTGNWQVKCDKPVKVIFDNTFIEAPFAPPCGSYMSAPYGKQKTFSGFTIVAEDGTKYIFGGSTNAIEFSISFFYQRTDHWIANAWYLTKIVDPFGNEVNFTYERDSYINQMYIAVNDVVSAASYNDNGQLLCSTSITNSSFNYTARSYGGKLVAPVYLKEIRGTQNLIVFNRSLSTELAYRQETYDLNKTASPPATAEACGPNTYFPYLQEPNNAPYENNLYPKCLDKLQWRKLDEVIVEDINKNVIKKYSLSYNNIATERLFLKSVTESDKNGNSKPPYVFGYDQSQPLPPYLSTQVDHWGFFNGTLSNSPLPLSDLSKYYGYREARAQYLLAGTLNQITYPTGGSSRFEYEPHWYGKRVNINVSDGIDPSFNTNTMAGGLRVRKIISSSVGNNDLTKEYLYVSGYDNTKNPSDLKSSGVLTGRIQYYFDDYRVPSSGGGTIIKAVFSSQTVLPASANTTGEHVGYSEVVEKNSDGSYKKFYYTNIDNGHVDEAATVLQITRTPYETHASLEEERGKLIKEEDYSDKDKLLYSVNREYTPLNKVSEYVPSVRAYNYTPCSVGTTGYFSLEGSAYKIYTYSYLPVTETTTSFDQTGQNPVKTSKTFSYDDQSKLLKTETFTDSKGQIFQTNYKYPKDFSGIVVYDSMVKRNIVAPVIEQTARVNSNQLSDTKINYDFAQSGRLIVPKYIQKSVYGNTLETETTFDNYDIRGNVLQVTGRDGVKTSYLWGYNNMYPVARIQGADYATAISKVDLATVQSLTADSLRNALIPLSDIPNTFVTIYTYTPPIGVTSETGPNGLTIYYEYDDFGRLACIKDKDKNIIKQISYNYASRLEATGDCINCMDVSQKCIGGVCNSGTKVYTNSTLMGSTNGNYYSCTYHYLWSDGTVSQDFYEHNSSPCSLTEIIKGN